MISFEIRKSFAIFVQHRTADITFKEITKICQILSQKITPSGHWGSQLHNTRVSEDNF